MKPLALALLLASILVSPVVAQESAGSPRPTASPTPGSNAPASALVSTPTDRGLPVVVRTALHVAEIAAVDELAGSFTGTVDLRLRWVDSRLRFPPAEALGGVIDLRGEQAEARLKEIWAPQVAMANLIEAPMFQTRRLRITPDGSVELLQRTSGKFTTSFDVQKFPFDRQELAVELVERLEPLHRLTMDFRQDDVEFSRAADGVKIAGWEPGLLHLRRDPEPTWHGESQARVHAALEIARQPAKSVPSIFLPLLATLLIPLLALWLQRVDNGRIKIETFELSNILIGGLFAVIALNFTISSAFPALVNGENTVTRLFGLNYLCLAIGLVINLLMFRFNVVGRLFGRFVLAQSFRFLSWGLPALVLSTAAAIILVAMV